MDRDAAKQAFKHPTHNPLHTHTLQTHLKKQNSDQKGRPADVPRRRQLVLGAAPVRGQPAVAAARRRRARRVCRRRHVAAAGAHGGRVRPFVAVPVVQRQRPSYGGRRRLGGARWVYAFLTRISGLGGGGGGEGCPLSTSSGWLTLNLLPNHTPYIMQHVLPLLRGREAAPWDVLVGHYLGADHAGHSHGVRSRQMAAKLAQMDAQAATVLGARACVFAQYNSGQGLANRPLPLSASPSKRTPSINDRKQQQQSSSPTAPAPAAPTSARSSLSYPTTARRSAATTAAARPTRRTRCL
jgi:hypothetical protein